ncbi:LysR substrate-binding domain-containing protein [Rhodococcus qingshengii]|uniref:LysR substrate-binding domain-containing protein n=1 Tax=Rhodococcus qingshengii TaxID=334542 RepID=UPI00366C3AC5
MAALDSAVQAVRSNADPESGLVRFGFPLSLGPISIPSLLADFHTLAPRIRLHLVQAHGKELVSQVRDGKLDLAVMIPAPKDLQANILGYQRISLYVAHDHPLSTTKSIDLTDLRDETFIANPPTFHLRQVLDSWCTEAGFTPRVPFEITEFDTLRGLVGKGLGVALLPESETRGSQLARIDITGPRHRTIALACAERANPAVLRLRDHIIAQAGSFVDDMC